MHPDYLEKLFCDANKNIVGENLWSVVIGLQRKLADFLMQRGGSEFELCAWGDFCQSHSIPEFCMLEDQIPGLCAAVNTWFHATCSAENGEKAWQELNDNTQRKLFQYMQHVVMLFHDEILAKKVEVYLPQKVKNVLRREDEELMKDILSMDYLESLDEEYFDLPPWYTLSMHFLDLCICLFIVQATGSGKFHTNQVRVGFDVTSILPRGAETHAIRHWDGASGESLARWKQTRTTEGQQTWTNSFGNDERLRFTCNSITDGTVHGR